MCIEEPVLILFTLFLGMITGSFLNVVAWRVPRGESIIHPRSCCTSCGVLIKWYDNIPVLSWFILRGRCRSCGDQFSFRYALVELITGVLFACIIMKYGAGVLFFRDAVFLSLLVCVILTDIDHWIILDSVSIGGAIAGIAFSLLPGGIGILRSVGAAAGALLLFFLIRQISEHILKKQPGYTIAPAGHEDETDEFQGGMGWGDIKLAAMIGAFLGPSATVVALFTAFLTGALTGIGAMIAGRSRRIPIPFGPFIALGAAISLFFGQEIWSLYLSIGFSY